MIFRKCSTLGDTPEKSIGQSQMISVEPSDGWEIPRLQQRYRPIAALLLFFTAKQCEVLFVLQMPMIWSLEKFLIQPYMICHCSTKASFSHHGDLQMRFLVNNSIFLIINVSKIFSSDFSVVLFIFSISICSVWSHFHLF